MSAGRKHTGIQQGEHKGHAEGKADRRRDRNSKPGTAAGLKTAPALFYPFAADRPSALQFFTKLPGTLRSLLMIQDQSVHDRMIQIPVNPLSELTGFDQRFMIVPLHRILWSDAAQHVIHGGRCAVDVTVWADQGRTSILFLWSITALDDHRDALRGSHGSGRNTVRRAKVQQFDLSIFCDVNVIRCDIPMDDPLFMHFV